MEEVSLVILKTYSCIFVKHCRNKVRLEKISNVQTQNFDIIENIIFESVVLKEKYTILYYPRTQYKKQAEQNDCQSSHGKSEYLFFLHQLTISSHVTVLTPTHIWYFRINSISIMADPSMFARVVEAFVPVHARLPIWCHSLSPSTAMLIMCQLMEVSKRINFKIVSKLE